MYKDSRVLIFSKMYIKKDRT